VTTPDHEDTNLTEGPTLHKPGEALLGVHVWRADGAEDAFVDERDVVHDYTVRGGYLIVLKQVSFQSQSEIERVTVYNQQSWVHVASKRRHFERDGSLDF